MRLTGPLTVAALLVIVPSLSAAQTSDTTPPTVVEFDFTPRAVDVVMSSQQVDFTARVTDDLAGATSVQVYFRSPSGRQYHWGGGYNASGDPLNRTITGNVTIPRYVESGTWHAEVYAFDAVSNRAYLDAAALATLGLPSELAVTSNPDVTPPQIASTVFAPALVDVSSADQVVTIDLRVTDDVSGLDSNWAWAYLSGPTSQQYALPLNAFTRVSGTPTDGIWRYALTLPRYSAAGAWRMNVSLRDVAGNQAYLFADTFEALATPQDVTPPALTGLLISPALINTSTGPVNVTVRLSLSDSLSGVDFSNDTPQGGFFHGIQFYSPSSAQQRSTCCSSFSMTSGTVHNGTWEAQILFPQYSEDGTWKASVWGLTDRVRNFLSLTTAQMEALGLPVNLVVVRPSLVGDGTVGSGGGTIEDDSFGDRAALTFPPGVLPSTTSVAIDVFPNPLPVRVPSGFEGPGTYFVNINLTPDPPYPMPAPGVTATLPLPAYRTPGTALPLFFVNSASEVEPMPDATTGLQVVGTVNADGLTATFTGISHFSILVALAPEVVHVGLDIKPKAYPNDVNIGSPGALRVALLSAAAFDAVTAIRRSSLTFGVTGSEASLDSCTAKGVDVNADGLPDLVCLFKVQATGFAVGSTLGILHGQTVAGENLVGTDSVRVVR